MKAHALNVAKTVCGHTKAGWICCLTTFGCMRTDSARASTELKWFSVSSLSQAFKMPDIGALSGSAYLGAAQRD